MRSFSTAREVLGALERRVMDVVWTGDACTVRDVARRLGGIPLAYTTVMTTLDRLFKKGLLTRERHGTAFVYRAALTRDDYRRRVVEAALSDLVASAPDTVLAAFVDTATAIDRRNLERLRRLIAERERAAR